MRDQSIDTVSYSVKSLGNYPIKTFADIGYVALFNKHKDQMLIEQVDSTIFNYPPLKTTRYISKEVPLDLYSFATHNYFGGKTLDSIKDGELSLLLIGRIIYLNPENGKPREYVYQAQLFPIFYGKKVALRARYFFTYNENFDLPYDTMTFIVPKDQYKFQRAKNAAKYQIETEENEFNRLSEPYFETFINSIDSITTHKIQITYSIVNISETPAEIIGRRTNYYVDTAVNDWGMSIEPTFDSLEKVMNFGINRVILKNDPVVDKFILTPKPPDKEYPQSGIDLLLKYNRYLYIADEIEFKNVISGKKMLYRYIIKINPYWGSQHLPFSQTIYHKIIEEPVK